VKKIFLLTLLLIPTLVFAIEDNSVESDSPWNFDIQYDYISLGDSYIDGSKKITTINLLLDSRLDENTTIHGDFYNKTTKSNYNRFFESNSVTEKGVREFYITSLAIPNTEITVGKKAFKIDNKKGIQDLGVAPLGLMSSPWGLPFFTSECVENQSTEFNKCVGVESAYIKSKLSEDLQIELLKTTNDKVYQSPIKGYKARLKHSTDEFDYYLTADKNVQTISPIFMGFIGYQGLNNNTSVELSLIEKKEIDSLNQWFVKAKHTKNNNNCLPSSNLYLSNLINFWSTCGNVNFWSMFNASSRDFLHSNSLTLGKVFAIDKLLINTEFNHNISTYNEYSRRFNDGFCFYAIGYPCYFPYITTHTAKKKIKTNSLSLMLEYPIKNGKITSSHIFVRTPYEGVQLFGFFPFPDNNNANVNLIDVTYNFTNSISGKLGYERFDFMSSPYSTNTFDAITYSMKYKF
jgi:hypothetical protein